MKLTTLTKMVLVLIVLVSFMQSVDALGITPSKKIVDFNSDLQQEFTFRVVNSEHKDFDIIIYPRGELADYVLIERNSIHLSKDQKEAIVKYKINVPYEVRKPGTNTIEIVVEESASDYDQQTAVGGKIAVVHQLVLKSPFLGTYANVKFTANNPEADQGLAFTYMLYNDGTEDISEFNAELQIFDAQSQLISTTQYVFDGLEAGKRRKDVRVFTEALPPGDYYAKTTIFYEGKIVTAATSFTVGGSYIVIESIGSDQFTLGGINKIDVSVYNRISQEVENVFAEIIVKDDTKIYSVFKTISVSLSPFTGNTLFGYWDTSNIGAGTYDLAVTLRYLGRTTEKDFRISVSPTDFVASEVGISGSVVIGKTKGLDPTIAILIVAFIVLMIINVALLIYIRRGKKPPENIEKIVTTVNMMLLPIGLEIMNLI